MIRKTSRIQGKTNSALSRPKKVAIYIRVSTTHQIDKDSLPMQRKDLTAYASLLLGIEDYEIFEDAGYSGKNTDRPAFQEMMGRIRKHEFSHVLVWKIDRISRNLLDFAKMYEELKCLGVTFVSKNEQFDTSTAMGEAMLKIVLVFAELERNMTSERVTATMISRAGSGLWNGGRIPYGYSYDADKSEFSIREDEAAVCQIMKSDYMEHHSLIHTSRFLNKKGYRTRSDAEWSPTAVWIILSSPFYAGIYRYNRYKGTENRQVNPENEWVMIYDHHPSIFTLEEHQAMLAFLMKNKRMTNEVGRFHRGENVHIFSGLVFCGKCGTKMTSTPGRLHVDGYRPSNYCCPHRRKTHECDNPTVSDTMVGEFVLNYIVNMLNAKISFSSIHSPAELETNLLYGNTFSDVEHVDLNGLNEFYNLLSRYGSDSSEDAMSEKDFITRKAEIVSKIESINAALGMAVSSADSCLSDEDFIRQASHLLISKKLSDRQYVYFKGLAKSVSPEILKEYMASILDSVYITDSHVTAIVFKNGLTHRFTYRK